MIKIKNSKTTETRDSEGKLICTETTYELERPIRGEEILMLKTHPKWKQVLEFVFPLVLVGFVVAICLLGL